MSLPFDNFKELLKTDPTGSCTFTEQKNPELCKPV